MGKMFVVGEVCFDYNDEYHSPAGEGGGVNPLRVFTSEPEAKEWALNQIVLAVNGKDWRTEGCGVCYDETFSARWDWFFEQEELCDDEDCDDCPHGNDPPQYVDADSIWDHEIDYQRLITWCISESRDPWDYLPRIYEIYPVEVGA